MGRVAAPQSPIPNPCALREPACYSARVLLKDLPTPQVLVDRTRLLTNIARMQQLADSAGMALRPHAKTHKSPVIAQWQIDRGAIGICCAKLGEAEVFAAAGIREIRLPYPINPSNADRVIALMDRAAISIVVDHLGVARQWSDAIRRASRDLDVLVKVDVGFHRCGIDPVAAPIDFIQQVASMRGLRLRGLLSHAGHGYRAASTTRAYRRNRRFRVRNPAHVAGPCRRGRCPARRDLRRCDADAPVQRPRARTDRASPRQLRVFRPDAGRAGVRDARGLRAYRIGHGRVQAVDRSDHPRLRQQDALSSDLAPNSTGYGVVLIADGSAVDESLTIERLSEEHTRRSEWMGQTALQRTRRSRARPPQSFLRRLEPGGQRFALVEGDRVTQTLPVAARGRITCQRSGFRPRGAGEAASSPPCYSHRAGANTRLIVA